MWKITEISSSPQALCRFGEELPFSLTYRKLAIEVVMHHALTLGSVDGLPAQCRQKAETVFSGVFWQRLIYDIGTGR